VNILGGLSLACRVENTTAKRWYAAQNRKKPANQWLATKLFEVMKRLTVSPGMDTVMLYSDGLVGDHSWGFGTVTRTTLPVGPDPVAIVLPDESSTETVAVTGAPAPICTDLEAAGSTKRQHHNARWW
jgi:hypothetical protein